MYNTLFAIRITLLRWPTQLPHQKNQSHAERIYEALSHVLLHVIMEITIVKSSFVQEH